MIKVAVNGAKGRMGTEVIKAVNADSELEVVAECDMGDDLIAVVKRSGAEVVVDFTPAKVGYENALKIIDSGARPVIGTSGFRKAQVEELKKLAAAKNIGGLIAPNFAIGAVLMMKFAREAAQYLPSVEILETHHDAKLDSPSGTAIRTAEMIVEVRGEKAAPTMKEQIIPGARGAELGGVHIHSMRLPGFVANQRVVFGGIGQSLVIEHNSVNRESFMPGVVLACKKVMEIKELVLGLENLL